MSGQGIDRLGRFYLVGLLGVCMSVVCSAVPAGAQSLERNPALPLIGVQNAALNAAAFAARPGDPTPFGMDLRGLRIVDGKVAGGKITRPDAAGGVNTAFGGPTAQNAALRQRLARFIGQPVSFQLLSQIQTDLTAFYRDNGRALVSVTVPQQEITAGVVQINVTAFVLATKQVQGVDGAPAAYLQRNIRLQPGQEVDTDRLLADVNWLNQNPFRHVAVQFEPGQNRDTTALTLNVQAGRPWSGYVGASNSGTEPTGRVRVYGGFNMSPLSWNDRQLSYQITGAPESIGAGHLWDTGRDKGYLSHALSYFIPVTTKDGFRAALTFGASHISSTSDTGGAFTTKADTTVLDAEMAVPLPKVNGPYTLVPEVYARVEYDDYASTGYFVGLPFTDEATQLTQITLGLRSGVSGQMFGIASRGSVDLRLVFGRRDTDGVATDYSFVKLALAQEVFVNPKSSVAFRLTGQTSRDDLHPLAQQALGGNSTVRGYDVNGVSGSTAMAASVEYRAPGAEFSLGGQDAKFNPHVFVDYGFAKAEAPFDDAVMRSVGFGGQFEVGKNLVGTLDVAHPFVDAGTTEAGAANVAFQMTMRF